MSLSTDIMKQLKSRIEITFKKCSNQLRYTKNGNIRIKFPKITMKTISHGYYVIIIEMNKLCNNSFDSALELSSTMKYICDVLTNSEGIQIFLNLLKHLQWTLNVIFQQNSLLIQQAYQIQALNSKIELLERNIESLTNQTDDSTTNEISLDVESLQEYDDIIINNPSLLKYNDISSPFKNESITEEILQSPNTLCSYESKIKYAVTKIRVILWKGAEIPDVISINNVPVVFVRHLKYEVIPFRDIAVNSTIDLESAQNVLLENYEVLFSNHSNLLAAQIIQDKEIFIKLVVPCLGFIPLNEFPFPKLIGGLKTKVVQGWFDYSNKKWKSKSQISFGDSISSSLFSKSNGKQFLVLSLSEDVLNLMMSIMVYHVAIVSKIPTKK